ncbi:hypothetical protein CXF80_12880 [Shewanella sp. Actino-trap-3]|nr:hypothetical protein CXF80_12880 [Shewanella sp. Actino-trap-3]
MLITGKKKFEKTLDAIKGMRRIRTPDLLKRSTLFNNLSSNLCGHSQVLSYSKLSSVLRNVGNQKISTQCNDECS